MHCISSIQVKQQRLLRTFYKQTVHIITGMSYQLKVKIEKFDFKFCNETLSIFIIEKRDENKSTDKLILPLEVICKAKELYIFVNKLSFYSFRAKLTNNYLHCSKVYRNKNRNRPLVT